MRDQYWAGRKLTVLGLSKSGTAVAEYVLKRGGDVFLSEVLPASPANEAQRSHLENLGAVVETGGHTKQCFTHAPLAVVSPGIPPSSHILAQLKLSGIEIVSEVELAYRENRRLKNLPLIGITGTNGKTTTTTLVSRILEAAGRKAPACGNIGLPIISVLDAKHDPDEIVAELSSFQLEFSPTLTARIAVFLNLRPDHLDWHGSLEAYQRAKLRLFAGEQSPEWSVVLADDEFSGRIEKNTRSRILWLSRQAETVRNRENKAYINDRGIITIALAGQEPVELFPADELKVLGDHNRENAMAASATAYLSGVSPEIIRETCLSFTGVEHRLERVTEIRDGSREIVFYNDSKATNTDAAISALRAFGDQKVILIAGGRDKHELLERFAGEVKPRTAAVVLYGEARERFYTALDQAGCDALFSCESLDEAIRKATDLSGGEPVLFSPACASFDTHRNFEERGKAFKDSVSSLREEMESRRRTVAPGS